MKLLKIHLAWAKTGLIALLLLSGALEITAVAKGKSLKKNSEFSGSRLELINVKGEPFTVKPANGKFILINFWATWCAPCRREMPELNLFKDLRKSGQVQVLAVCVDNSPKKIKEFLKEMDVNFDVLIDSTEKVSEFYKISQMPTTILLDGEGRQVFRSAGYSPHTLKKVLEKIRQNNN